MGWRHCWRVLQGHACLPASCLACLLYLQGQWSYTPSQGGSQVLCGAVHSGTAVAMHVHELLQEMLCQGSRAASMDTQQIRQALYPGRACCPGGVRAWFSACLSLCRLLKLVACR